MKGKDTQIYAEIASSESMSMKEILALFPEKQHQTIMRGISRLVNEGDVKHEKIWGKGKRPRYFVKEENTKNKLLVRAIEYNKKDYKIIKTPISQKELSRGITFEIKHYRQTIDKRDFKDIQSFIFFHLAECTHCLRWINQITWAIHSEMLGDSKSNITLHIETEKDMKNFYNL